MSYIHIHLVNRRIHLIHLL